MSLVVYGAYLVGARYLGVVQNIDQVRIASTHSTYATSAEAIDAAIDMWNARTPAQRAAAIELKGATP